MVTPHPARMQLQRYGQEVVKETEQMRTRICYLRLTYELPDDRREEVGCTVCGHCSARVYLEGKDFLDGANNYKPLEQPSLTQQLGEEPPAKRRRTAQECVRELVQLKELLECSLLTQAEFADLKEKLLQGD